MEEHLKYAFENISEKYLNPTDIMFTFAPILTPILQERFAFKNPGFREEREWLLFQKQVGNFDENIRENDPFFNKALHIF